MIQLFTGLAAPAASTKIACAKARRVLIHVRAETVDEEGDPTFTVTVEGGVDGSNYLPIGSAETRTTTAQAGVLFEVEDPPPFVRLNVTSLVDATLGAVAEVQT